MPATRRVKETSTGRRLELPDAALLGIAATDSADLRKRIEAGLPFSSWDHVQAGAGLNTKQLAGLLRMNVKTVGRRRAANKLTPDESDKLARMSRIVTLAIGLFEGDRQAATHWLLTPRSALGGASPLEATRTEVGAREVERLIERLEDGTFV